MIDVHEALLLSPRSLRRAGRVRREATGGQPATAGVSRVLVPYVLLVAPVQSLTPKGQTMTTEPKPSRKAREEAQCDRDATRYAVPQPFLCAGMPHSFATTGKGAAVCVRCGVQR